MSPNNKPPLTLFIFIFFILIAGIFFLDIIRDVLRFDERPIKVGATFSSLYAEQLGLDSRDTYIAMLGDLGVRQLRLPAYWNRIEKEKGVFDFSELDFQLQEAAIRDVNVILAVGRKLPRWPECHTPDWAIQLSEKEIQNHVLQLLETVVRRYKNHPTITMWQVENEPLFPFGDCPPADFSFLKKEISLVRSLDNRPIMLTDSGEQSLWVRIASVADVLGISTYRTVWTKYLGYLYFPIGPTVYKERAKAVLPFIQNIIISELQAEPWFPGTQHVSDISFEEQIRLMNPARLQDNIRFASRIGFSEAYLWGVEWWYWLKEKKNEPAMWNAAKTIFAR